MKNNAARLYTAVAGIFLLLQGTSTLAFRLYPAMDEAFPPLLSITQMVPVHSSLHILTGVIALIVLYRGRERGALWFAAGFGLFYTGLAFYGIVTGHSTILELKSFDHPFHIGLGIAGLLTAGFHYYRTNASRKDTS